jgi:hypothetical protein
LCPLELCYGKKEAHQVVKARGVLDEGVIRLRDPLDLPAGTEVDVVIEPRAPETEEERRDRAVRLILESEPIDIRPLTVRDLIEYGRER